MPGYKFDGFVEVKLVTNSRKLKDQSHRCSDNYHFHSIKQGGRIRWNIEGGSQLNISFNVKEDIKAGIDKEIFKGLKDGSETNMPAGDSIYIADVKQNGEDIKDSHLIKIIVTVI